MSWLKVPLGFGEDEHLVDDVHLNLDGYRLWAESLFIWLVGRLRLVGGDATAQERAVETETEGADEQTCANRKA